MADSLAPKSLVHIITAITQLLLYVYNEKQRHQPTSGKEMKESAHKRPALMKLIESIDYLIKEPHQLIIHPTVRRRRRRPTEELMRMPKGAMQGSRRGLSINQASRVEPEARTSHSSSGSTRCNGCMVVDNGQVQAQSSVSVKLN